jgi:hypothetical protein
MPLYHSTKNVNIQDLTPFFSLVFKRRLTFLDGRKKEVDVKAGSVAWMKAHIHIGENIGDTNTDVILVELKEDRTLDKTGKDLK